MAVLLSLIAVSNQAIGIGSLLFFVIFFLGVLLWVFRPGSKSKYKKWGKIPLKGDK